MWVGGGGNMGVNRACLGKFQNSGVNVTVVQCGVQLLCSLLRQIKLPEAPPKPSLEPPFLWERKTAC